MNFIQLPKPHGYLIWKGKQKAIASPIPILHDRFLTLISEGEAYGDIALSQPAQVSISELERLEEEHRLRPEERKLYYPDVSTFYIHRIKEWKPYEATKAVHINGSSFEYLDYHPSSEEFEVLNKAERLPKIIPLQDDAVVLEDTTYIQEGLSKEKIEPVLRAVLEDAKLNHASLPLYQLALVRIPRLLFKEKKSEDDMPYKVVAKHPECKEGKPVGVVNKATGKLEGCSENEEMAKEHMAALYANEKKEMPVEEGEKCMDEYGIPYSAISFADLDAAHEAYEVAKEVQSLSHQFTQLVSNIMGNSEIEDKPTALKTLVGELEQRLSIESEMQEEVPQEEIKEDEVQEGEKFGKKVQSGMMAKIKAAWETLKEFMDWAEPQEDDMAKAFENGQAAVKMASGDYWHFAWSTNAFEDREGEIFSTKSLEKYVEAAEKQDNRGFFNLWHIGTKENPAMSDFAEIKWQGVVGRILVEAGPYLPDEKGQAAKKFFTKYSKGHPIISPEGWGSSPEYRYLPEERKTGVYENIWKTRTSTLPRLAAANIWTDGGNIMALTLEQEKAAKMIFGEEQAAKIIEQAEGKTKELEQNVAHKGEDTTQQETTQETAEAKLQIDTTALQPFIEAMNTLNDQQNKIMSMFEDLTGRVKSLETKEEVKAKVETPRALLFNQRASQALETAIAEDSDLAKSKPVETAQKDKSGAAAFFPARH